MRIHCVRDCEDARRYTKAYQEYSEAHPGFDEDEPLDMLYEREPVPPPEMFQGAPARLVPWPLSGARNQMPARRRASRGAAARIVSSRFAKQKRARRGASAGSA